MICENNANDLGQYDTATYSFQRTLSGFHDETIPQKQNRIPASFLAYMAIVDDIDKKEVLKTFRLKLLS